MNGVRGELSGLLERVKVNKVHNMKGVAGAIRLLKVCWGL